MKGETPNLFTYVILGTLIFTVVGALIGQIANSTVGIARETNISIANVSATGAGGVLYGLTFLFFVIGLIVAILGMVGLKIKMSA